MQSSVQKGTQQQSQPLVENVERMLMLVILVQLSMEMVLVLVKLLVRKTSGDGDTRNPRGAAARIVGIDIRSG